jgi:hypothetical protein
MILPGSQFAISSVSVPASLGGCAKNGVTNTLSPVCQALLIASRCPMSLSFVPSALIFQESTPQPPLRHRIPCRLLPSILLSVPWRSIQVEECQIRRTGHFRSKSSSQNLHPVSRFDSTLRGGERRRARCDAQGTRTSSASHPPSLVLLLRVAPL